VCIGYTDAGAPIYRCTEL
jgi:hypothetical protein